ncbi:hypothetical protein ElyMa_002884100 [Elysia marginata]|uniref:Uncharacterized protein n=1 Tax=Elysia marginata TaxID=1093978 RepID=A0AAV4I0U9_9GAST|nr:hypothetical protein ElyMa_002884100 [Elysia marginata]
MPSLDLDEQAKKKKRGEVRTRRAIKARRENLHTPQTCYNFTSYGASGASTFLSQHTVTSTAPRRARQQQSTELHGAHVTAPPQGRTRIRLFRVACPINDFILRRLRLPSRFVRDGAHRCFTFRENPSTPPVVAQQLHACGQARVNADKNHRVVRSGRQGGQGPLPHLAYILCRLPHAVRRDWPSLTSNAAPARTNGGQAGKQAGGLRALGGVAACFGLVRGQVGQQAASSRPRIDRWTSPLLAGVDAVCAVGVQVCSLPVSSNCRRPHILLITPDFKTK